MAAALALLVACGYRNATAAPVVRRLEVAVPDYPRGAPPLRILLFSDLHVHGPDMPPARVARLVRQINALRPDLVLAAGDFVGANWVGAHYSPAQAIAPLKDLKARLGVYAVLGNNDYQAGASEVARALQAAGVRVLMNEAVGVGPVALAGLDGRLLRKRAQWDARRARTFEALQRTPGFKLLFVHRPDEFRHTPSWVRLVLAGHTHCGQISLPLIGAVETGSDYGRRYLCGIIRGAGNMMVVSAGVGTSRIPLRIGAPPDMWLVVIGGPAGTRRGQ